MKILKQFRLPEKLLANMDGEAKRLNRTRTYVVEKAVDHYFRIPSVDRDRIKFPNDNEVVP